MTGSFGVSGRCLRVSVTKFQDKFTRLGQVNNPNSWEKFQICCTDMYLIRFLPNFAVFCVLLWISRLCGCTKYQRPWVYELRHLHYTNWRLKICIWRLYFSSWSPKGDLRIFLISSPVKYRPQKFSQYSVGGSSGERHVYNNIVDWNSLRNFHPSLILFKIIRIYILPISCRSCIWR